jgi:competence protein ComEC
MFILMRAIGGVSLAAALTIAIGDARGDSTPKPLAIYFVDVRETVGNATLLVAPSGESMLLDAGPARMARRVVNVLEQAGVKRLDYLVTTHYHADHFGATAELAEKIEIRQFVDHGASVETGKDDDWWKARRGPWFKPGMGKAYDQMFATYERAREKGRHSVVRPGDVIPITGVEVRVLCAGGKVIDKPLSGAGGPAAASAERRAEDDAEDAQSIGVLVTLGSFRFVYLADLTWNKENELFAPVNRVGAVDAYLVTHHAQSLPQSLGDYYYGLSACPPVEVHGLRPRVAILSLGALGHRGGTSAAVDTVRKAPGLEDLWQTQLIRSGAEKGHNSPEDFIATIGGPSDKARFIKLSATADGAFTMTNSRNGFSKKYTARK